MAKQYIVKTTVHGLVKAGGKKVVIKSSPEPQDVPSGLVKELLERGVIEEYESKAKGKATDTADDEDAGAGAGAGEGDGASGD